MAAAFAAALELVACATPTPFAVFEPLVLLAEEPFAIGTAADVPAFALTLLGAPFATAVPPEFCTVGAFLALGSDTIGACLPVAGAAGCIALSVGAVAFELTSVVVEAALPIIGAVADGALMDGAFAVLLTVVAVFVVDFEEAALVLFAAGSFFAATVGTAGVALEAGFAGCCCCCCCGWPIFKMRICK